MALSTALLVTTVGGCDVADWRKIHEAVVPARAEAWESIPWRLDLSAAREEAEAKGRPLFLWAMNGHPCGCT